MNKKEWYKSKTVWTAIIAGVIGVAQAFGVEIPAMAFTILGALGLYGLRKGINSPIE